MHGSFMRAGANLGAIAGSIGTVNFGGRAAVSWPHRVGVVPAAADCRQHRTADDRLSAAAGAGEPVVCQVLTGLGGVGKTQMAAGLAQRSWHDASVDLLVWVTATSRENIIATYAQTAADITGIEDPDPAQAMRRLLAWLAGTGRRWLIVLDDLTNPGDLHGLWPPDTSNGRTVVTTRRRDAALLAGRTVVEVGLFTRVEARIYLRRKFADRPHLLDGADELAADLGYLPLALAQAVAFLLDRDLSCAEYRMRLADRRRRLADVLPEPCALPDQHQSTVAATWSLSIDTANQLVPVGLALPVLQIAALVDPNGIPTSLFTTNSLLTHLAGQRDNGRPVDADDVHDVLHLLHRFNLATLATGGGEQSLRVHALVQRAIRENTPAPRKPQLATAAADGLLELWPAIEPDQQHARALRASTSALQTNTLPQDAKGGVHSVLFQAGRSLGETGQISAAIAYFTQLHAALDQRFGPDHPDTLVSRLDLARWRGAAGDPAGAATAFEQLLADNQRVLGSDHRRTLGIRNSLAHWRGEAGDPAGAATAFEQLLADRLRVFGPDHPDVLVSRLHLARWRGAAGDPAGAATAFEQLLADYRRVLGPDHPHTLLASVNLAGFRGLAGDPAGAATAFEQLLADYRRVLGSDHPETLRAGLHLAWWRGAAGDPAGAATAFEQLLADCMRVLGPDHPDTHTNRSNLAYWREQRD